jgi:hypothetical protein
MILPQSSMRHQHLKQGLMAVGRMTFPTMPRAGSVVQVVLVRGSDEMWIGMYSHLDFDRNSGVRRLGWGESHSPLLIVRSPLLIVRSPLMIARSPLLIVAASQTPNGGPPYHQRRIGPCPWKQPVAIWSYPGITE